MTSTRINNDTPRIRFRVLGLRTILAMCACYINSGCRSCVQHLIIPQLKDWLVIESLATGNDLVVTWPGAFSPHCRH